LRPLQICKSEIKLYVGFRTPVDERKLKELQAMEDEKKIKGVAVDQRKDPTVWTVHLEQDRVGRLHGKK
jgi:hypothetical protein